VRRLTVLFALLAATSALLVASSGAGAAAAPKSYLIITKGGVPTAAQVAAAGGQLTRSLPQVGVAVASSADANFKSKASKLGTVVPNTMLQLRDPQRNVAFGPDVVGDGNTGPDSLSPLQWGHDAVDAPQAWAKGQTGQGALVAVLDDGIDSDHPDLAPNFRSDLSTSFVPGETYEYVTFPGDPFSHGTHTSGTVAAARNGIGVTGIAPDADFFMVKVLSSLTGSGSWEGVVAGIVYAADADADVINMSLGGQLQRRGYWDDMGTADPSDDVFVTAREVAQIANMIGRATTYAFQQGTTVVASAGNDALDKDHTADIIHLPSDAPHVISVAATAPVGWAKAPLATDLDNPASYTNYGRSAITLAAPGGDFVYPGNENCTLLVTRPCWVFDLVFSTGSAGAYYWSAGTSMAAPHVSGVAAIIVGKNGGSMHPAQVEAVLRHTADDLGQPGNDPFFGRGRVNASNAAG
jgi:subtilisin family serine protease